MSNDNLEAVNTWVRLEQEKRAAKELLDAATEAATAAAEECMYAMIDAGLSSIKIEGVGTVTWQEKKWASAPDVEALAYAIEALENDDRFDNIVKLSANAQTLTARVKEFEDNDWEIPASIAPLIKITPKSQPRLTAEKGSAKK